MYHGPQQSYIIFEPWTPTEVRSRSARSWLQTKTVEPTHVPYILFKKIVLYVSWNQIETRSHSARLWFQTKTAEPNHDTYILFKK